MGHRGITLIIDSDLNNTPLMGSAVNRLCQAASLSDKEASDIELCVVEAVTNSIIHCYRGEPGHEVRVALTFTGEEVVVEIWDNGCPLEAGKLERAYLPCPPAGGRDISAIPERGRGLAIIKEIMDGVAYRTTRAGNCLTLRKRVRARDPG